MALYCYCKTLHTVHDWTSLDGTKYNTYYYYSICFTNDPARDDPSNSVYYVEWTPGMTSYPRAGGTVSSDQIVKIEPLGDTVVLPEDCTGMFKNFRLCAPDSKSTAYNYYGTSGGRASRSFYKEFTIDFSKFDTSNVKNMTSMFENCLGKAIWYRVTGSADGDSGVFYTIMTSYIKFAGLNSWDLRNVANVSRMFANVRVGDTLSGSNVSLTNFYHSCYSNPFFNESGVVLDLPNCTNASNLFMNSNLVLGDFSMSFSSECDCSFMFSGFSIFRLYFNSNWTSPNILNIKNWKFTGGSSIFKSMFRNTNVNTVELWNVIPVESLTSSDALDYMFANDGSINVGNLTSIKVKPATDWHILNPVLSGYRMFSNDISLPNFNSSSIDINNANNTKSTGYFDQTPPEITSGNYIKLASGWVESDVYFKTEDGWKESEVYM